MHHETNGVYRNISFINFKNECTSTYETKQLSDVNDELVKIDDMTR